MISEKNNETSFISEFDLEDKFHVLKFRNDTDEPQKLVRDIDSNFIQFHFAIKGSSTFKFNEGNYKLPLPKETSLLLYNPNRNLPMDLEIAPNSWIVTLLVAITKFHSLFFSEASYIPFLNEEYKNKKYYNNTALTPSMAVVLNQLMNFNIHLSLIHI